MKKISVYLGSSPFCLSEFKELAFNVGIALAKSGHTIIYGGAAVGTMGALADGAQRYGGKVIGVFPKGFQGTREVRRSGMAVVRGGLDEMIEVKDFAERKQVMEDMSDCALILPGSYGTLDELFTYACNRAIDLHEKNIYVLNYKGYYDPLKDLLDNMKKANFLKESMIGILSFHDTIEEILELL